MRQGFAKHSIIWFYAFAFAISWASWLLMYFFRAETGSEGPLVYVFSSLGGLGPLLSLLILERLSGRAIRVKGILSTIRIRGTRPVWFLFAIFAFPAAAILGNLLYAAASSEDPLRWISQGPDTLGLWVLPVIAIHFTASLVTSPFFEEPGWRGFALGPFQQRFGRQMGSLAVGGLWWLWHQPMNLTFGIAPSFHSFLLMITFSFMIDSLFNLSGRNLFIAMLAHQSSGTAFMFLYGAQTSVTTLLLLVGFVVGLRYVEWRRAPAEPIGNTTQRCDAHAPIGRAIADYP